MDLFEYARTKTMKTEAPLASRIRPRTLDEVVGQHIIGKDKLLYRAISADKLSSLIFYGPPGTGKTTLAKVIANDKCGVYADQCDGSREKGHGRGREGEGKPWYVRQKTILCGRDSSL